ncbi:MAG TPA: 2-phospho-L-lactate guanylyltransferase [Actinomycetota bacterium]|jgi:2-phospho-L-lactate guanylyltransferase|nr:2-phospho-L-lactate guanylyltransferase [Actinomycetota bacterium]
MHAAILPVKNLEHAKARLTPHFTAAQRTELAAALLEDALDLAMQTCFFRWWVVSDDPQVIERAHSKGLGTVRDTGAGLNAALKTALGEVAAGGAESATVLPSDVPLAAPGDLADVLDTGATSDVVLVPSGQDGGTNALYMAPVGMLEPAFGPGSFQAHLEQAAALGLRCSILSLPRLALDIDTIEDVDRFLEASHGCSHTDEVLRRLRSLTTG